MATIIPGTYSGDLSASIGTINAGDSVVIQDSAVAFTTGLDLSAVEIDKFIISPSCTSDFGSAGSGGVLLDLSGSTYDGLLEYNGGGNMIYIDPATTIARTNIVATNGGTFYGLGGTWTQVDQGAGISRFNDTADVVTAHIRGGSCTIDVHSSQTLDTATVGPSASLICGRNIGTVEVQGSLVITDRTVTGTTVETKTGSSTHWVGANITTVNGYGGRLDLSGITQDVTIGTLNKYSDDFVLVKPAGSFVVTVTTENLFGNATSVK